MGFEYSKGEQQVQKMANEEKIAIRVKRLVEESINFQAMSFIEDQPFLIVSSKDGNNNVWTSILFGNHGFVKAKSTRTLEIDLKKLPNSEKDILFDNILKNPNVGTLFINHELRIRYRINGKATMDNDKISITVSEAYGNCPKYIQSYAFSPELGTNSPILSERGLSLNEKQLHLISSAHTFYLGTYGKNGQMDASHRGGKKGFVSIIDNRVLKIPDYPGNSMFNSLGNISEIPNCGLLFVDFEKGHTLQLTGKGKLLFDQTDTNSLAESGNTGRFWLFEIDEFVDTKNSFKIENKFLEFSPYNPE